MKHLLLSSIALVAIVLIGAFVAASVDPMGPTRQALWASDTSSLGGGIDGTEYSRCKWGPLRDNSDGKGTGGWGPEFTFGRAANITGTHLAKCDHSGYGMINFLGEGVLQRRVWDALLREVYLLGCEPSYLSYVFDQGEGDTTITIYANAYETNFRRSLIEFRAATRADLPVVTSTLSTALENADMATLYAYTLEQYTANVEAVNAGKAAVVGADSYAAIVDGSNFELNAQPNFHRTSQGTQDAGVAYAAALATLT